MTTPTPVLLPHLWKSAVLSGLLAIVVGAVIVAWPGPTIIVASIFFGVGLLFIGVQQLFLAFSVRGSVAMKVLLFISGAAALILAVMCLIRLSDAWELLAIWIAVGFIFRGVATTMSAIGDSTMPARIWNIVIGVITLIAGIVVMASPYESLNILVLIVGIWLIVIGVFEIIAAFAIRKATKDAKAAIETLPESID